LEGIETSRQVSNTKYRISGGPERTNFKGESVEFADGGCIIKALSLQSPESIIAEL